MNNTVTNGWNKKMGTGCQLHSSLVAPSLGLFLTDGLPSAMVCGSHPLERIH